MNELNKWNKIKCTDQYVQEFEPDYKEQLYIFGYINDKDIIFIGTTCSNNGENYADIKFPGELRRFIPLKYIGVQFEGRDNPLQNIKKHYEKTVKEFENKEWKALYNYYIDSMAYIGDNIHSDLYYDYQLEQYYIKDKQLPDLNTVHD